MNKLKKLTDIEVESVIQHAVIEALRHTKAHLEQHGTGPCGFAWVNIKPARGQFIKVMKKINIGRTDSYQGGYTVWNPSTHDTQCMTAKEAGAKAFAAELSKYGITCKVYTRLD